MSHRHYSHEHKEAVLEFLRANPTLVYADFDESVFAELSERVGRTVSSIIGMLRWNFGKGLRGVSEADAKRLREFFKGAPRQRSATRSRSRSNETMARDDDGGVQPAEDSAAAGPSSRGGNRQPAQERRRRQARRGRLVRKYIVYEYADENN